MKKIIDKIKFSSDDTAEERKRKQRLAIGLVCLGVGALFWVAKSGVKNVATLETKAEKPKTIVVADLIDEKETWISRLEEQSNGMTAQVANYKKQNEILEKRLATLEDALKAQAKERPLEKKKPQGTVKANSFESESLTPAFSPPPKGLGNTFPVTDGIGKGEGSFEPLKKILHFSVNDGEAFHHAKDYVVAGTNAGAVLTSGVVVSTSVATQGNPQPIMMRLADHGNLPRGWKSRLKDAVMIGSCYGDLSSERAICRLHTLSFVERSGRTVEKAIEGWIIGEDGAPGLRGKVVDKAGKVVREAFVAGMLSGMSSFFKSSAQSSVFPVSPFGQTNALKTDDVLKSGAAQGTSNALEKLADFSIKRAEAMSPVLVVHPGRVVDVVFKKGFDLSPNQQRGLRPVSATSHSNQTFGGSSHEN